MKKTALFITACLAATLFCKMEIRADIEKTVHVLSVWDENSSATKIIKELSEKYQQNHPKFHLELKVIDNVNSVHTIDILAASNELPDLFVTGAPYKAKALIDKGMVVSIDQLMKDTGNTGYVSESVRDGMMELVSDEDDKLWALPVDQNIEGFWYNKKLFREQGWIEPKTVDEMMGIAQQAKSLGIQPFISSGMEKWPINRLWGCYVTSKSGVDTLKLASEGKIPWNREDFIEAYKWLQNLGTQGYLGSNIMNMDEGAATDLFLKGDAAMYYSGSWILRDFTNKDKNTLGNDIGFFGFPAVENGTGKQNNFVQNYGLSWLIGASGYDAELADWLDYIFTNYGDYAMEELSINTGFILHQDHETNYFLDLVRSITESAGEPAVWPEYHLQNQAYAFIMTNVDKLLSGEITPEKFGKGVEAAVQKDLRSGV